MNESNWRHIAYGLAINLAFGAFGAWLEGWAFASAWFISREHAQRELQLCAERGIPSPSALRWYEGFTGWRRDRWLDSAPVVVACGALCALVAVVAWLIS
jgi:hypothetical protein